MSEANSISKDKTVLVSTFYLGEALFGIDTLNVQEVVPLGRMTPVHHAPASISGIINLRGQIVTVVDLAERIGLPPGGTPAFRHIMIVTWQEERVGLLVDEVADVVTADLDNLAPPPVNVRAAQRTYILGVCEAGAHMAAVLDLEAVLKLEEDETTDTGGR